MFIGSLVSFLILLGIVILVHELGHLIIARANGVFCEVFSVGFGKTIWERSDKLGTKWRISLLPIGGYVKMFGDADVSSVKERIPEGYTEEDMDRMSAHRKKPWQRLLIAAGGPASNFVFAIVVLFSLSSINGVQEYGRSITVVSETTQAFKAGLRSGDEVVKANGIEVRDFNEFREQIVKSNGKELEIEVLRDKEKLQFNINMFEEKDGEVVPIPTLGVSPREALYKRISILGAFNWAVVTTWRIASENICSIIKIATGRVSAKNVGGIISIFKISSESAEAGIASFIFMIAMISIVLGAINLLPVPVLDGGTVIISAIEWLVGRPLNRKFVETIFTIGLVIVVGLMSLGVWNDLVSCKFFVLLENLFK